MQVDLDTVIGTEKKEKNSNPYMTSIVIMSVVSFLSYFYANSLSPILSVLAKELNFSDYERDHLLGSRLNAIYYLSGCPLSLLFSFIGDSNKREVIFMLVSFIGHISSFLLPFFSSYTVFCIWRALSGAAVTSILPLYLSILSDMFPLKTRTVASVIVTTVTCMGTLIGQTVSSFFATRYGWRFFFRLISSLGIISTISLIFMKYPRKGESDMAATTPIEEIKDEDLTAFKLDMSVLTDSLSVPTNWIVFFQLIPECMPWGVYNVYIQDILHIECGFTLDFTTLLILLFGLGGGIGSVMAAKFSDWLNSKSRSYLPIGLGFCDLFVLPFIYILFNVKVTNPTLRGIFFGFFMCSLAIVLALPGPSMRSMVIDVNKPHCRSTMIALGEVFNSLGRVLGPIVFVWFVKRFDRVFAIVATSNAFFLAAVFCFIAAFTYKRDCEKVEQYIQQQQPLLQ